MRTINRYFTLLKTGLILLFWISGFFLNAQESYITISGILKDAGTGEKINFATITIPNTGIGTVSNSDGEFTLKISSSSGAEYFEVSHLSYATKQFKISDAVGKEQVYTLEMKPVQLKEVPVNPEDARYLVQTALKNTRKNYGEDPIMMTGFYRESILQNQDYISISEAVVDIYKSSYVTVEEDQVKIYKGRKGTNVKKADTLAVNLQGGPQVLLLLDVVKYSDIGIGFDKLDNYNFEISNIVNIDEQLNWVIDFSPRLVTEDPLYFGKVYISKDDLAITRIEFALDLRDEGKASTFFVRKKPIGLVFKPISTGYLVTYKEDNGQYYLNYARVDLKFRCDWKRRLFKKNYTLVSEMAITDRKVDNVAKFASSETFKQNMILSEKVQDFNDSDFWGEKNIIEPEKSIENAIKKISKGKGE